MKKKKKKYDEESDDFYRRCSIRVCSFFFFRNLTEQSESVPGIETRRNCEGFIGTRVSL